MKKHLVRLTLVAMVLCASFGCSTTTAHKLNKLNLGMSQEDVTSILGDNYVVEAAATDTNGARLQMWDYTDKKTQDEYRLYFKDGKLAQWGKKGDTDFPTLTLPSHN
ncbi:MAG TPA: hypothetical protein VMJ12_02185 [Candidatus Acidoferrales bacterium]|nr:hypothetical protein [Candidatus Acidoferrales bacterium]